MITLNSYAYGNAPQIDIHSTQFADLSAWEAAGYYGQSSARADADTWDPPYTESATSNSFSQDQAHDAVMRAAGIIRQPYRGRFNNEVKAISQINLNYNLEVTNLASANLNIVFGNTIEGVFAVKDLGHFALREAVDIPGIITGGEGIVRAGTLAPPYLSGFFENTVTGTTLSDPVWGTFSEGAYQLHSYQFYGSQQFAPGQQAVFNCFHRFEFFCEFDTYDGSGLAMFDFGNTAHLTVKAYDPVTGADRSDEISVRLTSVPEPMTWLGLSLPAAVLLRRRRR